MKQPRVWLSWAVMAQEAETNARKQLDERDARRKRAGIK